MRHDELKELTGAYALDAVDTDESDEIERHLSGCSQCRSDVAELREVAASLGVGPGLAPFRVWDRIAAEVSGRRQAVVPMPAVKTRGRGQGRGPGVPTGRASGVPRRQAVSARVFVAVVAVAAVVVAALSLQIGRVNDHPSRVAIGLSAPGSQTAWQLALSSSGARLVTLKSPDGSRSASAVVLPDGTSMLGPNNLAALSDQRSYQLWGKVGPKMVSLAVLRTPTPYQEFSTPAQTMALIITNEPASGVISTTKPPVVSAPVPAQ